MQYARKYLVFKQKLVQSVTGNDFQNSDVS